jgi:hypothetical protein
MRRLVAMALITVGLVACGSSAAESSSGAGEKYVAALEQSMGKGVVSQVFTAAERRCLATHIVDALGVNTLDRAAKTPKAVAAQANAFQAVGAKLDASHASKLEDLMIQGKCFDYVALVSGQLAQQSPTTLGRLPRAKQRCFLGTLLKRANLDRVVAAGLIGRSTAADGAAFQKALGNSKARLRLLKTCGITQSQLTGG